MKTHWKWILGSLVILAVIIAIPLGMHYLMGNGIAGPGMYTHHHSWMSPAFDKPFGFCGWDDPRGFDVHHGWNRPGHGFSFFGGLLKLAVFFGLLYGAYWLGKRNARITLDPSPIPPAVGQTPAPKAPPASASKRSGKTSRKG
jgi:hypothetical protein